MHQRHAGCVGTAAGAVPPLSSLPGSILAELFIIWTAQTKAPQARRGERGAGARAPRGQSALNGGGAFLSPRDLGLKGLLALWGAAPAQAAAAAAAAAAALAALAPPAGAWPPQAWARAGAAAASPVGSSCCSGGGCGSGGESCSGRSESCGSSAGGGGSASSACSDAGSGAGWGGGGEAGPGPGARWREQVLGAARCGGKVSQLRSMFEEFWAAAAQAAAAAEAAAAAPGGGGGGCGGGGVCEAVAEAQLVCRGKVARLMPRLECQLAPAPGGAARPSLPARARVRHAGRAPAAGGAPPGALFGPASCGAQGAAAAAASTAASLVL
ncbi:MAG: hypothetical protein J3K34DRAFT_457191 [Monoraphidium minutum]|nr:MAG: hypothetical protein J3K34DRAFT_457191 [Monoraphidium minutum]